MLDSTVSERQSPAIASATTTNVWSIGGASVHVTGANAITSLGSAPSVGATKLVIFDGALTLTHGVNLVIPGGVNLTTAAGDVMLVYAETISEIRVMSYTRANGKPIADKGWFWVSTSTPSAVSSLTLSSLVDGTRYRLTFKLVLTQNEPLRLRFNANASNVYAWGSEVTNDSADIAGATSGGAVSYVDVTGGQATNASDTVEGVASFVSVSGSTRSSLVHFSTVRAASAAAFYGSVGHGVADLNEVINSVNLSVTSGTMTGQVILERLDG
jgi:hypothetical protein